MHEIFKPLIKEASLEAFEEYQTETIVNLKKANALLKN